MITIDAVGFELGYDIKRYGQRLKPDSDSALREGWEAARIRYGRHHVSPDRNVLKWLQLRRNAHKRSVFFDPRVTADYLGLMAAEQCPVTGITLTTGTGKDTDGSIDRVLNLYGYSPGNIVSMSVRANRAKGAKSTDEIRSRAASGKASCGLSARSWNALRYIVDVADESYQGQRRRYLKGEQYVAGLPYSLSAKVQAAITSVAAIEHSKNSKVHPIGMLMAMLHDNSRRATSKKLCFKLARQLHKCGSVADGQLNWGYWGNAKNCRIFTDYWEGLLPNDRNRIGAYLEILKTVKNVSSTPSKMAYSTICETEIKLNISPNLM